MKALQDKLDKRSDEKLKEKIAVAARPLLSMMLNCMKVDYEVRQKASQAIETMKGVLFDAMQNEAREQESKDFLESVESVREQLDSLQ